MTMTELGATPATKDGPVYLAGGFDACLQREWLITNGRGGYASGTVAGVPTRRYHGLLVAAARPPLERWLTLSAVLEKVTCGPASWELASFEFEGAIHPQGYRYLVDFDCRNQPDRPWVRFVYAFDGHRLVKHVTLLTDRDEVAIGYRIESPAKAAIGLSLCPFVGLRDFHSLVQAGDVLPVAEDRGSVRVDAAGGGARLWLTCRRSDEGSAVTFEHQPDHWHGFRYRQESARGQDDREDLFVPGWFHVAGTGTIEIELRAAVDFSGETSGRPQFAPPIPIVPTLPPKPCEIEDRLREAASAFVVRRSNGERELTTILAGYHWFGDWGRDTFIALLGLLLETGRFDEACQVLDIFASAQKDGLIPNRFSDYGEGRDYNSVDASLWFVYAADAYVQATGDETTWRQTLGPACERMAEAFLAGTQFNIQVDPTDGLLACGDAATQLTWMDAKCGNVVFTPRHGKPVEVNALWYHALCILAERTASSQPGQQRRWADLAERTAVSFAAAFWNERGQCLYDVVRNDTADPAVRPNQIFAVSLGHSPLDPAQQQAVVRIVEERLLTPFGLRSLCPRHPAYAGRYQGNPFERDSVYHQGTVWGWLIGPYVEAALRVQGFSPEARVRLRERLMPLVRHLDEAGMGSVSEVFDGDPPHRPGGCIAQAWSVAELLRAWRLTAPR